MSAHNEQSVNNWWAEGDTPVHADSHVTYLVDAHSAFLSMCRHFLMARKYIYIAAWGLTPLMELVRGADQRAGPDGSPEQEALLAELRTEGLQEAEIDFWCSHNLTVQAVLGYMVSKGVEVKVLIWSSSERFSHCDPQAAHEQLTQLGVSCMLDDSAHGILHHPIESLHQKIAIVDGTHAFVGGIDMLIELSGDYDRWDTHSHHYSSPLRRNEEDRPPHNWHDAHAIIEGSAVADVEHNFRQRWNDVIQRHEWDNQLLVPQHPLPPALESTSLVQVARTIPAHTYSFAPEEGLQGIAQLYANALSNAQHFVYLENQYFWTHAFFGIDRPRLGTDSPEMERNLRELAGEESMLTIARHLGHQRQRRRVDEEAAALLQHLQETLGDPVAGLRLMIERAEDNLRRFKAKQPLVGHLLPYVRGEEAKQQGWHFHEEHGWIEVS